MTIPTSILKNELNNLLSDIKNDLITNKNEIENRLKFILELIEKKDKYSKPIPIISNLQLNDINTNTYSNNLNDFLNEKKISQEKLIEEHEKNLEKMCDRKNFNNKNSSVINEFEEIYWSSFLHNPDDSNYIQMKKLD